MLSVKLLNKSGYLVRTFYTLHEAYKYAIVKDIEGFSVHTTLS